jgi:hypothetical protein
MDGVRQDGVRVAVSGNWRAGPAPGLVATEWAQQVGPSRIEWAQK